MDVNEDKMYETCDGSSANGSQDRGCSRNGCTCFYQYFGSYLVIQRRRMYETCDGSQRTVRKTVGVFWKWMHLFLGR